MDHLEVTIIDDLIICREELSILLKGSLRIAQNNCFAEDTEEQEEGLKVENVDK